MRKRHFAIILVFLALCIAQPARAGWFSKRESEQARPEPPAAFNLSVDTNADQAALEQMKQLQANMVARFNQITADISAFSIS